MTAIVTKKSVRYVQEKMHNITFNLVVSDGGVEVINKDFSCQYQPGETPAQKVAILTKEMQVEIDRYKAEQVIFNSTALNTAVTNIQGGLLA
jgi:hypothetical protein